jgi:hypothetical protein
MMRLRSEEKRLLISMAGVLLLTLLTLILALTELGGIS